MMNSKVKESRIPDIICEAGGLDMESGLSVLLRRYLDAMNPGEILVIRSQNPMVEHEIGPWCRWTGHSLCESQKIGSYNEYWIQRGTATTLNVTEKPDWDLHPRRQKNGSISMEDWGVGRLAFVPEEAPQTVGFAPRGAVREEGFPGYGFRINRKEEVWSEEIAALYEHAAQNQWSAVKDIPWGDLKPLPELLERAVCQLMTFLVENEYSALYVPGKFISRINPQFTEVVLFLGTQLADEARHIEVFTKRALANGGGLQYSATSTQMSLKTLYDQEDFTTASFLLSVLGEGTFLDLLWFIETYAPDPVTAEILRRARQDESRHVRFGITHLKFYLQRDATHSQKLLQAVQDRADYMRSVSGVNPLVQDALVFLAGGGESPEQIRAGMKYVHRLYQRMHKNRIHRLQSIGLPLDQAEKISLLHTPNFM
ncbi:MAG TPA: hypothetical protein VNM22_05270 [Candidatus Limnocylindrales bacterium]|nr:hypothetical protein [Candidatus Limnocylindrales bacterium]